MLGIQGGGNMNYMREKLEKLLIDYVERISKKDSVSEEEIKILPQIVQMLINQSIVRDMLGTIALSAITAIITATTYGVILLLIRRAI